MSGCHFMQQKMILKNFNIRQRAVNETPPMTGFQNQNLFKLPHEKKFRKKMLAVPITLGNTAGMGDQDEEDCESQQHARQPANEDFNLE